MNAPGQFGLRFGAGLSAFWSGFCGRMGRCGRSGFGGTAGFLLTAGRLACFLLNLFLRFAGRSSAAGFLKHLGRDLRNNDSPRVLLERGGFAVLFARLAILILCQDAFPPSA